MVKRVYKIKAIADITIDDFLRSSPVPADLETVRDQVTAFIREHQTTRRRIVLVTVSSFVL